MKPPIRLPSPPSTQIMKISGPNVLPMNGCTSYCSASRQAGAEPGQRAADRRGHEVDAALVDAHQGDDVAVLGDGANRRADIGTLEEAIERDRPDERDGRMQSAANS
jgi:hypothetical protein